MSAEDESRIVFAAQRGDMDAFAKLVMLHQHSIRACLAVRLNDPQEAEDLAQEAFIVAHGKLADFDAMRPFRAWVRGIALNLLLNYWRKFRAQPRGHGAELEALADRAIDEMHEVGDEAELLNATELCLAKLEEPSRELVKLRYAEGRPLAEVCLHLGKRHSAVTMWLHRVREALRACVEQRLLEARQ